MTFHTEMSGDDFASLPDQIDKSSLYTEHRVRGADGVETTVYRLSTTPVGSYELRDTAALKKSLQEERKARKQFEEQSRDLSKRMSAFEGIDDPAAAREALEKIDSWDPEEKLAEHKKRFETQLQEKYSIETRRLTEKHDQILSETKVALDRRTEQLRRTLFDNEAMRLLDKYGGSTKLVPNLREMTRIVEDDQGSMKIVIPGPDGEPRLSSNSAEVQDMTMDELIAEMKAADEWGNFFSGSGRHGLGSEGRNAGDIPAAGRNPWKKESRNLTEQMRLMRENPDQAKKLMQAAGVKSRLQ